MFLPTVLALATTLPAQPAAPAKFELKDGDRVVWIGNTLVEREQRYGHWETALHAAFPNANFTFRNLGWSGDTVFGEARASFDAPAKGFERLVALTLELKPTVILVSYGTNESFEGEAGLPKFDAGLNKLLDALAPAKARVVLMSPTPAEKMPSLPGPDGRNKSLELYRDAIKGVAAKRGLLFADLYRECGGSAIPLTENGIHYGETGYSHTAAAFVRALGVQAPSLDWNAVKPLREAIVEKNQLFFYKWRPQNETYLTGFRKHEQGKNAKEVAEFDPLITKVEDEIESHRKKLLK